VDVALVAAPADRLVDEVALGRHDDRGPRPLQQGGDGDAAGLAGRRGPDDEQAVRVAQADGVVADRAQDEAVRVVPAYDERLAVGGGRPPAAAPAGRECSVERVHQVGERAQQRGHEEERHPPGNRAGDGAAGVDLVPGRPGVARVGDDPADDAGRVGEPVAGPLAGAEQRRDVAHGERQDGERDDGDGDDAGDLVGPRPVLPRAGARAGAGGAAHRGRWAGVAAGLLGPAAGVVDLAVELPAGLAPLVLHLALRPQREPVDLPAQVGLAAGEGAGGGVVLGGHDGPPAAATGAAVAARAAPPVPAVPAAPPR
jgi:hypothetical protein